MPQRLHLSTRARPPLKSAKDPAGGIKFIQIPDSGFCTNHQIILVLGLVLVQSPQDLAHAALLHRTLHFYGVFYVQIVFIAVKLKSKGQRNSLSCESKLLKKWFMTWVRTRDQQKRSPRVCRSINYTISLDPCIFLYFSTTQIWFLYLFLHIDFA